MYLDRKYVGETGSTVAARVQQAHGLMINTFMNNLQAGSSENIIAIAGRHRAASGERRPQFAVARFCIFGEADTRNAKSRVPFNSPLRTSPAHLAAMHSLNSYIPKISPKSITTSKMWSLKYDAAAARGGSHRSKIAQKQDRTDATGSTAKVMPEQVEKFEARYVSRADGEVRSDIEKMQDGCTIMNIMNIINLKLNVIIALLLVNEQRGSNLQQQVSRLHFPSEAHKQRRVHAQCCSLSGSGHNTVETQFVTQSRHGL